MGLWMTLNLVRALSSLRLRLFITIARPMQKPMPRVAIRPATTTATVKTLMLPGCSRL